MALVAGQLKITIFCGFPILSELLKTLLISKSLSIKKVSLFKASPKLYNEILITIFFGLSLISILFQKIYNYYNMTTGL